jgi:hypothetical protein|tara:strand:- start:22605 stop:22997 length:393 start_codon:yes stop_codon:yes gene_type:complete
MSNKLYRVNDSEGGVRELLGSVRDTEPEERIAVAVLLRAMKDCSRSSYVEAPSLGKDGEPLHLMDGTPRMKKILVYRDRVSYGRVAQEARTFLSTPNEMLSFWCDILFIHPGHVNDVYKAKVKSGRAKGI